MKKSFVLFSFALGLCSALFGENITFPADGGFINVKQAPYFAAGDGVADDSDALQAAIWAACDNGGKMVYLPNGTYRVTKSIDWRKANGRICLVQGQSEAGVVIKLADGAAGFGNASSPKRLLWTGSSAGLTRFGNTLRNLTIDTGNNPGAIALRYATHNIGRLDRVTLRGNGVIGLDMAWDAGDVIDEFGATVRDRARGDGPAYIVRLTVDGFKRGIATDGGPYQTLTFEHITLRNQTEFGFTNGLQILTVRKLTATGQRGQAFLNDRGYVTLVDSDFSGDPAYTSATAAFRNKTGVAFVRNLTTSGYARVIADDVLPVSGAEATEWTSEPAITNSTDYRRASLNLPVVETPEPDVLGDEPSTWLNIENFFDATADGTDWSFAFERAMAYSASNPAFRTIYVPTGTRSVRREIPFRGNIQRILGADGHASRVNGGVYAAYGNDPTRYCFIMDDLSPDVVVWDTLDNGSVNVGRHMVNRSTNKTLIVKESLGQAIDLDGTGNIFFENFSNSLGHSTAFVFKGGGHVWGRNLNPEGVTSAQITTGGQAPAHVRNDGSVVWLLGMKIEYYGGVLETINGGATELLGGGMSVNAPNTGYTMFKTSESSTSVTSFMEMTGYGYSPYDTVFQEGRNGTTLTVPRGTPPSYPATLTQDDGKRADEAKTNPAPGNAVNLYAAYAGVFVDDDFADGTRAGFARATASTAARQGGLTYTSVPWTASNVAATASTQNGITMTTSVPQQVWAYLNPYAGHRLTLLPGETLSLSFDYFVTGTADAQLRFGVFDWGTGARHTADGDAFNGAGLRGYTVHTSPAANSENQSDIFAENNGAAAGVSFGNSDGQGSYTPVGASFGSQDANGVQSHAEFRVTRNANGTATLRATLTVNGVTSDSGDRTESELKLTAFDSVAVQLQSPASASTLRFDNVRLVVTSPPYVFSVPAPQITSPLAVTAQTGAPFTYRISTNQQIAADFEGDADNIDLYPGTAGGGWLAGWVPAQTSATTVQAQSATANPLTPDGGSYLTASFSSTGSNKRAFVGRAYEDASHRGIVRSFPHTVQFDIRPDQIASLLADPSNVRLWFMDRPLDANVPNPQNDTSVTWCVRSGGTNPDWRLYNGADVATGVRILVNRTYRFVLQLNPATRQFTATVTNLGFQPGDPGAASFTSGPITWRSTATTLSGQLYFGATVSTTQAFPAMSLDRIAALPTPAATVGASSLPPGLSFNAATGVISGTPTTPGMYSVGLSVAQGARTGSETFAVQVNQGQLASLDVGNVGQTGETMKVSADHYVLDGSGADIWGTNDAFRYAYFPASGQMDIRARVVSVENSDPWTLAGVMIRADTGADAAHALVAVTPERGITFIRRPEAAGNSAETTLSGLTAPKWVRLLRRGGTLTAFHSADGQSWLAVGGATVSLPTAATIGLAVSAHNNSALAMADFDNLFIAPPAPLPSSWTEGDVGAVGQTGATLYNPVDASYVVAGSGADIWDAADAFHFTYRTLSGDGQIVAKLESVQNTDPWAMAGVMIRDAGGSDAAHAFLGITAGQRVTFIRRPTAGGGSADTTAYGPTTPQWLKLVRAGTTVTAYRSTDGSTWILAGSATVSLGTVVNVGLVVCAHQSSALAAARFVQVQVTTN